MLDMVRNGSASALVQDKSLVEYYAATNCEFAALPDSFHVWDLAFGYSYRMPRRVIEDIDRVILRTQDEDALFDRLQTAHINMPNKCDDISTGQGPTQITMAQVRGTLLVSASLPRSLGLRNFWRRGCVGQSERDVVALTGRQAIFFWFVQRLR